MPFCWRPQDSLPPRFRQWDAAHSHTTPFWKHLRVSSRIHAWKKITKLFVKLKVVRYVAWMQTKFYEFLRQIQDSRLNRSRVFHFTILSLHKDHWPLPPEIAKFYFTSLAKKRLMIFSKNRFPHVRFRYFSLSLFCWINKTHKRDLTKASAQYVQNILFHKLL